MRIRTSAVFLPIVFLTPVACGRDRSTFRLVLTSVRSGLEVRANPVDMTRLGTKNAFGL